jgi:predicted short-subunit dehydrogenase-like oxidoreductase (DUF2520 family)
MAKVNLADPAFEPTGEQLAELFKRGFADVGQKHRESLARLRAEIARLRVEARRRVATRDRASRADAVIPVIVGQNFGDTESAMHE